jgi:N-methylhydantoinase A
VEFVTLQVVGIGLPERPRMPDRLSPHAIAPTQPSRPAYFGRRLGWRDTAVIARTALATPMPGPAIVEEYDCTCLLPPGATASLDGFGNIIIDIEGEPSA